MKHRVLVLVAEAYGSGGGIAQFNRNLLDGLSRRDDLEVRSQGLYGGSKNQLPQGLRWKAPVRGRRPGYAIAALTEAFLWRPHLVICGLIGLGSLSFIAARLAKAPLWSIVHGFEAWEPGVWWDNLGLRESDLVTAVSETTRQRLLSWCPLQREQVRVLPNAIDLARFRPGPRPSALERRYDVAGKRVLLTVGRLDGRDRYKGHDRVIRLLPELQRQNGPVRYLIVGTGDDRLRLEELAVTCKAEELVTFVGEAPEDELLGLYQLADLFVMPSTAEGFGIVFLEAMASGCPVIGGDRDGTVDALAGGRLGTLVDPDDSEALLTAIGTQLRAGRRQDRPIAGVEQFALPAFHQRLDQLINELLLE